MSFNVGTNLFSYFKQRMNTENILNSYSSMQVSGTLKGSVDSGEVCHRKNENDIICGKSMCGKDDQPTWEYCFK